MPSDQQESTWRTWQWGPLTATLSLDSISGIMLDPVFLSGIYDQNQNVNDDDGGAILLLYGTMLDLVFY